MKIQHNLSAQYSDRQLSISGKKTKKSLEKLASGYRINKAADNAGAMVISEKMRTAIRGLGQAEVNVQDGLSLIEVADAAMGEVHSILGRLADLTMEAANAVYTTDDRKIIQEEVNSLVKNIETIVEGTNFNGIKVLKGGESVQGAMLPPWASTTGLGNRTSIIIQAGNQVGDQIVLDLPDIDLGALNLDNVSVLSVDDALITRGFTKHASSLISTERSRMGAYQNTLEKTFYNHIMVLRENTVESESRLRDTDVSKEMITYNKDNIVMKASEAMLAQSNLFHKNVLQLLA